MENQKSFTLIEVILTITIVMLLSGAGLLILSRSDFLGQSRDTTRLADLQTLNINLLSYRSAGQGNYGSSSVVYVSLPSSQSNCGNLGLPYLPFPWTYSCKPDSSYRKTDGTGWIPVNFNAITGGPSFTQLPIDPINSTSSGLYYMYVTNGNKWELNTLFESQQYNAGGNKDKVTTDGGDSYSLFEVGTDLVLIFAKDVNIVGYWKFDEGSGSFTADASGGGNNGQLSGNPTWVTGKNGYALRFSGGYWGQYIGVGTSTSLQPASLTFTAWVKRTTDWSEIDGTFFNAKGTGGWVNQGPGWVILHDGTEPMWVWLDGSKETGVVFYPSNLFYPQNTWVHIGFTFDASLGLARSFRNGAMWNSQFVTGGAISTDTDGKYIGIAPSGLTFSGILDDIRVYNTALSPAEIKIMYNATK